MLRVTVELLPRGREAGKRTLGVAEVANVRGGRYSDYEVTLTELEGGKRSGELRRYPRWSMCTWDLVVRALAVALTGQERLPRRPRLVRVPVRKSGTLRYVWLEDIPQPARAAFEESIAHSTCPIVDEAPEPRRCAYAWDWEAFLDGLR